MQIQLKTNGFLNLLMTFLGPLMRAKPPRSAHIADGYLVKDTGGRTPHKLPLADVETVYWNTNSNSFAFVARGHASGLLIPLVENADELAGHIMARGITLEREMTSPRRRFLD